MEKFSTHTGVAVPLRASNVDTDQIIPAVYLKRITKTGFDDALFARWRQDPGFILNQEPYKNGSVLIAGADFGTGSSREHAVWALKDYGFRVVISSRFADIFRGNSGKQGLVAAQVTVDLPNRTVTAGSLTVSFYIDPDTAWRLAEGLDDIDLSLRQEDAIAEYEARRPSFKPATLPARS